MHHQLTPLRRDPLGIVSRMSEAAAAASDRVPPPFRSVVDRTLVDVACATTGGIRHVARDLQVDVPAVDAWRATGVPREFRARLTAMTVLPPLRPGRCTAA